MHPPHLTYLGSVTLRYEGDCVLLGVMPDLTIYAEEIYADDSWLCQHRLTLAEGVLESADESSGQSVDVRPLAVPASAARSQPAVHTRALNFAGPRQRGMRDAERISDMVRELSIAEKMRASEAAAFNLPPMLILGLSESHVYAEAALDAGRWYAVCRRVRIAYRLPEVRHDTDGEPYEYDSAVLHAAHLYDARAGETSLDETLRGLNGAALHRPQDVIAAFGHLIVADGGGEGCISRVHVWRIDAADAGEGQG